MNQGNALVTATRQSSQEIFKELDKPLKQYQLSETSSLLDFRTVYEYLSGRLKEKCALIPAEQDRVHLVLNIVGAYTPIRTWSLIMQAHAESPFLTCSALWDEIGTICYGIKSENDKLAAQREFDEMQYYGIGSTKNIAFEAKLVSSAQHAKVTPGDLQKKFYTCVMDYARQTQKEWLQSQMFIFFNRPEVLSHPFHSRSESPITSSESIAILRLLAEFSKEVANHTQEWDSAGKRGNSHVVGAVTNSAGREGSDTRSCFRCHKVGHLKVNCPQPPGGGGKPWSGKRSHTERVIDMTDNKDGYKKRKTDRLSSMESELKSVSAAVQKLTSLAEKNMRGSPSSQ
jgi:hypothetical protein